MDRKQLSNLVMRPLLKKIPVGYSIESLMAIQMIIAHESQRGEYLSQLNGGPAAGIIQMERATYASTWRYGATCFDNALLCNIITNEEHHNQKVPDFDRLLYDIRYNIFMARQRLFMKKEEFPNASKPLEMSYYLKKHWNSVGGAADPDSYYKAWAIW